MAVLPRMVLAVGAVALAASAAAGDDPDVLQALERQVVSLIERTEPSVVGVSRGRSGPAFAISDAVDPFGPLPDRGGRFRLPPRSGGPDFLPDRFGAGVVVADRRGQRFVLTTAHLVRGGPSAGSPAAAGDGDAAPRLRLRFRNGRGCGATILAADPRSDLAVLAIEDAALRDGRDGFPPPLPLSQAEEYRKGQIVLAFGNPYATARDGSPSVGLGMISNVARRPAAAGPEAGPLAVTETIHQFGTLLQIDARTSLGFGGGPIVSRTGELVGLTTALAALEGYETTAGFAVPVDGGTRRVIDSLLAGHEAEYGLLGVEPDDADAAQLRLFDRSLADRRGAVRVSDVRPESPAGRAGVRPGDFILAIDGKPVHGTAELMRDVGLAGPGTPLDVEIYRRQSGDRRHVTVTLGKWPVADEKHLVATVPRRQPWHGLTVDYATARQRFLPPRLDPYPRGVVVLASDEPLGDPALRPGDFVVAVNGKPVESPEQFHAAVRAGGAVLLELADGRRVSVP